MTPEADDSNEPLEEIIVQHVDEAAHLRRRRSVLVRASDTGLRELERHDERIAAHLDGIALAGKLGAALLHRSLEQPAIGDIFTLAVRSIEDRDLSAILRLVALVEAVPACRPGLLSAFGWVSAPSLRDLVRALLRDAAPTARATGLAACALHGIEPGAPLAAALQDDDDRLRAEAARVAGRTGRRAWCGPLIGLLENRSHDCAFESARSAVLLGDRDAAVFRLAAFAADTACPAPRRSAALDLLWKLPPVSAPFEVAGG